MENQNNNLQELEQLRSQVAEFKSRMEQQEIVSQRLLKQAMTGHVSWIKQMSVWGGVLDLALVPLIVYLLKSIVGVSWLPIIVVCIVMAFEAFFNFWNVSTIRDKYLAANDVINTQKRLRTYKRREKLYFYIIIPFLLLWIVWLLFDVYSGKDIPFPSTDRLIFDFTAIAIILAICFYVFYREMHSLNKAIKEIDEFANGVA
ncbi:MAG: hypothetical protein F083_2579 [bacterium F083]|nr:MAG: hypothetical protein F083_2579 [bacterium F083]